MALSAMERQVSTQEANPSWSEPAKTQNVFDFLELPPANSIRSHTAKQQRHSKNQFASMKRVMVVHEGSLNERPCISSSNEAISFFKRYWQQVPGSDQERFVIACLDTKNRVQSVVQITVGTLDASLVHPREVFKPAFIEGSSSIILSHNHPSGNTTPSREDIQVTDRLTEAGKLLGIDVLDHVIYGDGTHDAISIREAT